MNPFPISPSRPPESWPAALGDADDDDDPRRVPPQPMLFDDRTRYRGNNRSPEEPNIETALENAIAAVGDSAHSIFRSIFSTLAADSETSPHSASAVKDGTLPPAQEYESPLSLHEVESIASQTVSVAGAISNAADSPNPGEFVPSQGGSSGPISSNPPSVLVAMKTLCTNLLRNHLDNVVPQDLGEQLADLIEELLNHGLKGQEDRTITCWSVILEVRHAHGSGAALCDTIFSLPHLASEGDQVRYWIRAAMNNHCLGELGNVITEPKVCQMYYTPSALLSDPDVSGRAASLLLTLDSLEFKQRLVEVLIEEEMNVSAIALRKRGLGERKRKRNRMTQISSDAPASLPKSPDLEVPQDNLTDLHANNSDLERPREEEQEESSKEANDRDIIVSLHSPQNENIEFHGLNDSDSGSSQAENTLEPSLGDFHAADASDSDINSSRVLFSETQSLITDSLCLSSSLSEQMEEDERAFPAPKPPLASKLESCDNTDELSSAPELYASDEKETQIAEATLEGEQTSTLGLLPATSSSNASPSTLVDLQSSSLLDSLEAALDEAESIESLSSTLFQSIADESFQSSTFSNSHIGSPVTSPSTFSTLESFKSSNVILPHNSDSGVEPLPTDTIPVSNDEALERDESPLKRDEPPLKRDSHQDVTPDSSVIDQIVTTLPVDEISSSSVTTVNSSNSSDDGSSEYSAYSPYVVSMSVEPPPANIELKHIESSPRLSLDQAANSVPPSLGVNDVSTSATEVPVIETSNWQEYLSAQFATPSNAVSIESSEASFTSGSEESTSPGSVSVSSPSFMEASLEAVLSGAMALPSPVAAPPSSSKTLPISPMKLPTRRSPNGIILLDDEDEDDNHGVNVEEELQKARAQLKWRPLRRQLLFMEPTEPPRVDLCAGCGSKLMKGWFTRPRVCRYSGLMFCTTCHTNRKVIIPARILWHWDFKKYPVCNFYADMLNELMSERLFDLIVINPTIFKMVPRLKSVQILRGQLRTMQHFMQTCREGKKIWEAAGSMRGLVDTLHFSINDLIETDRYELVPALAQLANSWEKHILNCQLCRAHGSVCTLCNKEEVIFPFHVRTVAQCRTCGCVYHRACYQQEGCERCRRRNIRPKHDLSE